MKRLVSMVVGIALLFTLLGGGTVASAATTTEQLLRYDVVSNGVWVNNWSYNNPKISTGTVTAVNSDDPMYPALSVMKYDGNGYGQYPQNNSQIYAANFGANGLVVVDCYVPTGNTLALQVNFQYKDDNSESKGYSYNAVTVKIPENDKWCSVTIPIADFLDSAKLAVGQNAMVYNVNPQVWNTGTKTAYVRNIAFVQGGSAEISSVTYKNGTDVVTPGSNNSLPVGATSAELQVSNGGAVDTATLSSIILTRNGTDTIPVAAVLDGAANKMTVSFEQLLPGNYSWNISGVKTYSGAAVCGSVDSFTVDQSALGTILRYDIVSNGVWVNNWSYNNPNISTGTVAAVNSDDPMYPALSVTKHDGNGYGQYPNNNRQIYATDFGTNGLVVVDCYVPTGNTMALQVSFQYKDDNSESKGWSYNAVTVKVPENDKWCSVTIPIANFLDSAKLAVGQNAMVYNVNPQVWNTGTKTAYVRNIAFVQGGRAEISSVTYKNGTYVITPDSDNTLPVGAASAELQVSNGGAVDTATLSSIMLTKDGTENISVAAVLDGATNKITVSFEQLLPGNYSWNISGVKTYGGATVYGSVDSFTVDQPALGTILRHDVVSNGVWVNRWNYNNPNISTGTVAAVNSDDPMYPALSVTKYDGNGYGQYPQNNSQIYAEDFGANGLVVLDCYVPTGNTLALQVNFQYKDDNSESKGWSYNAVTVKVPENDKWCSVTIPIANFLDSAKLAVGQNAMVYNVNPQVWNMGTKTAYVRNIAFVQGGRAEISSVTYQNGTYVITPDSDNTHPVGATSAELQVSNGGAVDTATLSSITLTKNNTENISVAATLDGAANKITVSFEQLLPGNYSWNISGVKTYGGAAVYGSVDSFTVDQPLYVSSIDMIYKDADGIVVADPMNTGFCSADGEVTINSATVRTVTIISFVEKDGKLNRVDIGEELLEIGENVITVKFNDLNNMTIDQNNNVRILVWEDLINMKPVSEKSVTMMNWENLSVGGGGYVTGVLAHPTAPDEIYVRTDIGGLYKMNADNSWDQLLSDVDYVDYNLYGVDAMALDPNDHNVIYIASGKFDWSTPCDILKSNDGGKSWERTNFNKPIAGDGDYRWCGEAICVDKANSNNVFVITREDGLFKSTDSGATWQCKTNFQENSIGRIVQYDKSGTRLYAGVEGEGIFVSNDNGDNWLYIDGSPLYPTRFDFDSNDTMYVAATTGIFKLVNGVWQNITPNDTDYVYGGISVNPNNPETIICITQKNSAMSYFANHTFISYDGGENWTDIFDASQYEYYTDWDQERNNKISAASSIIFNPSNTNEVYVTDWYGVWVTENIYAPAVKWKKIVNGIENTVCFSIACPPGGDKVFAGFGDLGGFKFDESGREIIDEDNFMQMTTSIDFCEADPNIIVRVGGNAWNRTSTGFYSTDYGNRWEEMGTYLKTPEGEDVGPVGGKVAVAADKNDDGIPTILMVADGANVCYSTDYGNSFTPSTGLPGISITGGGGFWNWGRQIASDRVNKDYFYTYRGGKFYTSSDGGKSFHETVTFNCKNYNNDVIRIYAAPNMPGEVWLLKSDEFLYKSSDYGESFTKVTDFSKPILMCFGKNSLNSIYPTVYVYGELNSEFGLFRSTDMGKTWIMISNHNNEISNHPTNIEGDRQEFGVVYVTTNGSGFFCGKPKK